jgi:hypothetical protein
VHAREWDGLDFSLRNSSLTFRSSGSSGVPSASDRKTRRRLWAYLRSHYLSNRAYHDYDDLFHACGKAWNQLTPEHLCSICRTEWVPRTNQS